MGAVYFDHTVYLDHNATTPLEPRVRDAMLPWMGERCANPSSVHAPGRAAREAVETARDAVAELLAARPPEIVFTASGTEANNTVLESAARQAGYRGHLVLSAFEHPSVERAAGRLERAGLAVSRVKPGSDGVVDAAAMEAALRDDTLLACLMLANNEVGTLQPVAAVAAACRRRGVPVLCDAVQAVGKVPVDVHELDVDYLVVGAHKFYGPLGAAALCVRGGRPLEPLLVGGSQERSRRASTINVPAVVGLGRAAELAREEGEAWAASARAARDRFEAGLAAIRGAVVHGAGARRLPNTSHVAFPGTEGESLLIRLDLRGFAVSTGSACGSGTVEPSRTMRAMGVETREALASLRVSFGKSSTSAEVDAFLEVLAQEVAVLRGLAPAPQPAHR